MLKSLKNISVEKKIIEGICFIIAVLGVITSIRMNLQGHSLWWDEAALAYSFSQRDLFDLTKMELEKLQSAPVGWLYILKICTLIFGNTDFVLRVPSIVAYVGTLFLVYWILSKVFQIYYPMAGSAFVASIPIILQYSNIFKPYISDCFFSLLTVVLFYWYKKGKIGWSKLGFAVAILIWFSNPTCFVVGGMMVSLFIYSVIEKDKNGMLDSIRICIPVLISFLIYYFYWLKQTATNESMVSFWQDWNLPLFPTNIDDVLQIIKCAKTIFAEFYRLEYIIIIAVAACLIYAFRKKDWIYMGIYISFAVCLLASGFGKFPVNKRLWLYIYPLVVIAVMVGIDVLINKKEHRHTSSSIVGIMLLGCCVLNGGIRYYWNMENTYWPRYELKMGYEYIIENIEKDEAVYVCVNQTPIFDYYNHYTEGKLYGLGNKVMKGDNMYLLPYEYEKDINFIKESKNCYVMMGDGWTVDYFLGDLFKGLYELGYFEMVFNPYETPVWYFCADMRDSKTEVTYEIINLENERFLRINNVGKTYINTLYEKVKVYLLDENNQNVCSFKIPESIAPGNSYDIELDDGIIGTYSIHFKNEYKDIDEEKELIIK